MGRNNHALVTGLFLIVLVTAATSFIYWIGTMNKERNIYVISTQESVSGLNPESTVFFRGIAVGKVLSVKFDPMNSGIIIVPIEVDNDILLTKGVYATLQLKGVTGLTQIQLEDTGKITEKLPPGDDPLNRIPLVPSLTDKLLNSGEELLQKADHLMIRVGALLNDENEKNIGGILGNLKTLTDKLSDLQLKVDIALAGVPDLTVNAQKSLAHINALSTDAQITLKHIDTLTGDLQTLTKEVQALSVKAAEFADTGKTAGDLAVQTTLPKINEALAELQTTTNHVKRVATMLENNPQSLLLGPDPKDAGPGEPGFKESQ